MKCKKTKKEIYGYKGEVKMNLNFENDSGKDTSAHYYQFKNITFNIIDGIINIKNTFTEDVMNNFTNVEFFPNIKVNIISPFIGSSESSDTFTEAIILKNSSIENELYDFAEENKQVQVKIYSHLGTSSSSNYSDNLIEAIDIDYPETTDITYYEIIVKSILGKFRGYMKLDFTDIQNESDLLEAIEGRLLDEEEYEWSELPPFGNTSYLNVYKNGIQGVLKNSSVYNDDADAYLNDMFYLLKMSRNKELVGLFKTASSELSISDFDESMEWNDICIEKGYTNFKEIVEKEYNTEELKIIGEKIMKLIV